jgi:YVTN family beta-propeller protein
MTGEKGIWRAGLLGIGLFVLLSARAGALTAYVSNEKSNTISVIDIDKFAVIKTIKVGQRPRGIESTKDGKFILVAVGDDDTIQMIDTNSHEIVATLPSGPDPEFIQDPVGKILYVANENDNTITIIDMERRARIGEVQVGVEPEGMGISPDGRTLVNTSETTNMAHFIDTETRQVVANVHRRCASALRGVQAGRLRALGFIRDRRNGHCHRPGETRGNEEDHLRHTWSA